MKVLKRAMMKQRMGLRMKKSRKRPTPVMRRVCFREEEVRRKDWIEMKIMLRRQRREWKAIKRVRKKENCFSVMSLKRVSILSSMSPFIFFISIVLGIGCILFTLPV